MLPLKPAIRYDLGLALTYWLDDPNLQVSFQPSNPLQFILPKPDFTVAQCRDDLQRLQSLRNCLSDCLLKPDSHKNALANSALEDCQEYHAVLLEFEKRGFPTVDDETTPIHLAWKGAFVKTDDREKHATLVWDRACVTYNIAALWTQKAANCSPTDRDECKQAVGYCQQAACVLAILKELCQSEQFATVDLSGPMLTFWEKLLLAQAQTSIYRMASLAPPPAAAAGSSDSNAAGKKKHSTLAILSQSAYQLFTEALTAAQDPRLESEVPQPAKLWATYCKAVGMLAASKAEYHQSVVYRLDYQHGREIAQLRDCQEKLKECRDFIKNVDDQTAVGYTKRECLSILPVVTDRLHEADADNYRTYHEEIPHQLPDIAAKQLARPTPDLPAAMLVPQKELFMNV